MAALCSVLMERKKDEQWRLYMAEMGWSIARALYRDFPMPSYTELAARRDTPADNRTAQDIMDEVLKKLGV